MAKKKVTQEEQEQHQYKMVSRSLHLIPEPSYFFSAGDPVRVGSLDNAIVDDVLDNGKIYKIQYSNTNHNYGNPITTHELINFFQWTSVRPIPSNEDFLVQNDDIFITNMNQEISSLFAKIYSFGLDFDARYQRGYVWDDDDEERLINSIFSNVDIGKFVFIHNKYSEDGALYTVVDGKQRLNTLCRYFENRFSWNGFYFNDLSWRMRHHFTRFMVAVGEISNITEEQEVRLFLMLNESGKPQSEEHLDYVRGMLS